MSTKDNAKGEESKVIKINKWDGGSIKNALDDAVKEALLSMFGYKESFTLVDGRLAICTVAVAIAGFALLWDYLHPFPQSKLVLLACVVGYFIFMGILTLYTTYLEKGIFVVANEQDPAGIDPPSKWEASSSLKKYDDMYELVLTVRDGKSKKVREAKLKKSVAYFFDSEGVLVNDTVRSEVKRMHNSISSNKKIN
nr:EOG090X0FS4 [Eulimnadia texana]